MSDREEAAGESGAAACDRCGRESLGILGDEALCESCYHSATACCGAFGGDEG